jgi:4-amino-4-deoxy-L-arabinose transferase-like glycosyltransferase
MVLLVVCAAFAAAWNLGGPPVTDLMEVRNLVTAREMALDRHWLLPTMNGELRIAKPPLPTWLAAVSATPLGFAAASPDLWSLRLPTVALALLGALATVFYARRLGLSESGALWAGLILMSSFLYARHARVATWDVPVHAFAMVSIAAFGETVARRHVGWAALTALAIAASFLSKWPQSLGVMVLPWLAATALVSKPLVAARRRDLLVIVVLGTAGCLAWPLYVYLHEPLRAASMLATEAESLVTRHVRPVWAYAGFPIYSGAWTLLSLAVLSSPFLFKSFFARREVKATYWWLVLTFVMVSLVPAKKDRYLIPLLFPMAILIAAWAEDATVRVSRAAARLFTTQLWLMGAAGAGATIGTIVFASLGRVTWSRAAVAIVLVGIGVSALLSIAGGVRALALRAMAGTLVMASAVMAAGWQLQAELEPFDKTPPAVGELVARWFPGRAPVFVPDATDLYMTWAAGRRTRAFPNSAQDVEAAFPEEPALSAAWVARDAPDVDQALARLRTFGVTPRVTETQRLVTDDGVTWNASKVVIAEWRMARPEPPRPLATSLRDHGEPHVAAFDRLRAFDVDHQQILAGAKRRERQRQRVVRRAVRGEDHRLERARFLEDGLADRIQNPRANADRHRRALAAQVDAQEGRYRCVPREHP